MDKQIKSNSKFKRPIGIALGVIALIGLSWLAYSADKGSFGLVKSSEIEVAEVIQTNFKEGITVTGEVIPNKQTFIDASESGTVEKIKVKSGEDLKLGDTIMLLSNSDLQLEVLQRESQLLEQLNTQRQTRILLNQNDLSQKQQIEEVNYELSIQKRRYERNQVLFKKKVIAKQDFEEITKRYQYLKKRQSILQKVYRTDSIARENQLKQIDASEVRLTQNLVAVQNILDKLCITSPMNGKLSDFEFSPGQLINEGQRIGIIYDITPPKIEAFVDELYINSIKKGLKGTTKIKNESYPIRIDKKYPGVVDGDFKIEMGFDDSIQDTLYNGQTLRVNLNLSKPKNVLVIPKGRFYSNTGGQWIFVLKNGVAERRQIEIGQQNEDYYEVAKGLKQGEKVIISNYDNYMNYNTLEIKKS